MKNYKRWFHVFVLITVVWFSSMGCVTKGLWRDTDTKVYNETIIAFYSNPIKNEIIFIGKKYHYIFNEGTIGLQEVLKSKELLALNKSNLQIHTYTEKKDSSVVHTGLGIHFEEKGLNLEQKNWLINHGFNLYNNYVPMRTKHFSLKGKRYQANNQVNIKALKLKESINIQVSVHYSNTLYKVLMTPLTVTADAGLALAGAVIIPIMWIAEPRSRPKILR
jgi:hypothetical protein